MLERWPCPPRRRRGSVRRARAGARGRPTDDTSHLHRNFPCPAHRSPAAHDAGRGRTTPADPRAHGSTPPSRSRDAVPGAHPARHVAAMEAQLDHALDRVEGPMTRLGRAIGPGQLTKRGEHWVLDYKAGDGRRVREVLSTDKRVAERIRAKRISQRDLEMSGLGAVEGQSRPLVEIRDAFVADLDTRSSPRYRAYARQRIDDVIRGIHAKRVCDLRPYELIQLRARMLTA